MPEYSENLYLVWGIHGALLVDAISHTDAQEVYCEHFNCHVTMVEFCMRPPTPSVWAKPWDPPDPPEHLCGYEDDAGDDSCAVCESINHWMEPVEIEPDDPRLRDIDVERAKPSIQAHCDQMLAYMRDTYGDNHRTQ